MRVALHEEFGGQRIAATEFAAVVSVFFAATCAGSLTYRQGFAAKPKKSEPKPKPKPLAESKGTGGPAAPERRDPPVCK